MLLAVFINSACFVCRELRGLAAVERCESTGGVSSVGVSSVGVVLLSLGLCEDVLAVLSPISTSPASPALSTLALSTGTGANGCWVNYTSLL